MPIQNVQWTQMRSAPSPLYGWQLDANITGAATAETQYLGDLSLGTDGLTYVGPVLPYGPDGRVDDGQNHAWRMAFRALNNGGNKLSFGINVRQPDGSYAVTTYAFAILDASGNPYTVASGPHAVFAGWSLITAGMTSGLFVPEVMA